MQDHPPPTTCAACTSHTSCYDAFTRVLREGGGRLTGERRALLETACKIGGHFNPEMLWERLREEGHRMALTTIYRNLDTMVEAGILRKAPAQGPARHPGACYEHVFGRAHHDHLVCSECGLRVEFSYPAIDVLQEAVAREHGFVLERHTLELVGVCVSCREKRAT